MTGKLCPDSLATLYALDAIAKVDQDGALMRQPHHNYGYHLDRIKVYGKRGKAAAQKRWARRKAARWSA